MIGKRHPTTTHYWIAASPASLRPHHVIASAAWQSSARTSSAAGSPRRKLLAMTEPSHCPPLIASEARPSSVCSSSADKTPPHPTQPAKQGLADGRHQFEENEQRHIIQGPKTTKEPIGSFVDKQSGADCQLQTVMPLFQTPTTPNRPSFRRADSPAPNP